MILDEATAFTDPQNEDKIQKSIMALSKGKTLLVIAHRLSTIQNADQIVVLKKGRLLTAESRGNSWNAARFMQICGRRILAQRTGLWARKRRWLVMFKSMKRIIRWAGKYRGRLYLGSVFSFSVVYLQPSRQWLLLMRWINLFRHIGRIPQLTLL